MKERIPLKIEPVNYEHYEEEFRMPLYHLILDKAEEKDISLVAAVDHVLTDYMKTIRYNDKEYEDAERQKQWDALHALVEKSGGKLVRQWEGEKDAK